jgi:hypothetical protein
MQIAAWLDGRTAPPELLKTRLRNELQGSLELDATKLDEILVATADRLLRRVIAASDPFPGGAEMAAGDRRAIALDLLTADALVTYAMEAAAENCASFESDADAAMARLCLIGA